MKAMLDNKSGLVHRCNPPPNGFLFAFKKLLYLNPQSAFLAWVAQFPTFLFHARVFVLQHFEASLRTKRGIILGRTIRYWRSERPEATDLVRGTCLPAGVQNKNKEFMLYKLWNWHLHFERKECKINYMSLDKLAFCIKIWWRNI